MQDRLLAHQQRPQQQTLDMGTVAVERGLIGGIGFQEQLDHRITIHGLGGIGESLEGSKNSGQFAVQIMPGKKLEVLVGIEQGNRLGHKANDSETKRQDGAASEITIYAISDNG